MINGVILQKLQTLEDVLTELKSLGKISVTQLENEWRTRRVVERNFPSSVVLCGIAPKKLIYGQL